MIDFHRHTIVRLLTIYTGDVLDEESEEDALIDILNLGDLLDATILGSLLEIVLLTFRRPETEEISTFCLAHLLTNGSLFGKGGTTVDCCTTAKHEHGKGCLGSKGNHFLFHSLFVRQIN